MALFAQELARRKQADVVSFAERVRCWQFRQQAALVRCSAPCRPEKARKLGMKAKQGFSVFRVRIKRGDRKTMVSKGIIFGKPCNHGVNKMKATRNLRGVAEERAGRKLGGLRVLNSYWVGQDAVHKWFEVIMVDPAHNAIRNDARMNWICDSSMKHREMRGITAAGKKARGLTKRGPHRATKCRPSRRAVEKRHNKISLRRFR